MNIPYLQPPQIKILETHLQQKVANHEWVESCVSGKVFSFPYCPKTSGAASILDKHIFLPTLPPQQNPILTENVSPRYLINIPMGWSIGSDGTQSFINLLNLIKDEAFGANGNAQEVVPRLAVVIGINQLLSIDEDYHSKFIDQIKALPKVAGIAYATFGFFWIPTWVKNGEISEHTYTVFKAYLLLKVRAPLQAKLVQEALELPNGKLSPALASQIPFQKIRQTILKCVGTTHFAKQFEEQSKQAPIYYCVMDADMKGLRRQNLGYFSRLDTVLQNHNFPSAASLGYSFQVKDRSIIDLSCLFDMKVREAMNRAVPYGPYFPEPGSVFLVRKQGEANQIHKLSFLGEGHNLENKRLIKNGRLAGIFNHHVAFVADGGVITSVPPRAFSSKNQSLEPLSKTQIKQKTHLQAIRDMTQSHIFPKQWADSLYAALGFSCPQVTDVTGPMTHIFSIYDPISRMFATIGTYSSAVFDNVIAHYHEPLTVAQAQILDEAKGKLRKHKMPEDKINQVVLAAQYSGEAIRSLLVRLLQ